ncbi:centromere protein S-like [Lineus longissimus]|uniref:centromere protein S-like n=1 Tax=Lineus longissimus TaxID=88925 RepID=UPI002B4EF459
MAGGEDNLVLQQRLRAAVFYTVGRICEEHSTRMNTTFTKSFIATVAETTFRQLQSMSLDLEAFAKHAKRSTIQPDDVLLLVRKSQRLYEHMKDISDGQAAEKKERKKTTGKGKPGKKSKVVVVEDDMDFA